MLIKPKFANTKAVFLIIGTAGWVCHNTFSIFLTYFNVNILVSNCIGFLVANQFTYLAHTKVTFDAQRSLFLRLQYLFLSIVLLILTNVFVYVMFFKFSLKSWVSLTCSTLFVAALNFLILQKIFRKNK